MAMVRAYRAALGCQVCGEKHPACLVLHHRDPAQKSHKLTRPNRDRRTGGDHWARLSYAEIASELEKCDVLCANCHLKLHADAAEDSLTG